MHERMARARLKAQLPSGAICNAPSGSSPCQSLKAEGASVVGSPAPWKHSQPADVAVMILSSLE